MTNAPTPAGMAVSEIAAIIRKHALSRSNEAPTPRESVTAAQAVVDYLAAQPSAGAEPVAWRYRYERDRTWQVTQSRDQAHRDTHEVQPLYTRPAPVQPDSGGLGAEWATVLAEIEAALKEGVTPGEIMSACRAMKQPDSGGVVEALREARKWISGQPDRSTSVYETSFSMLEAIDAALAPVAAEGGAGTVMFASDAPVWADGIVTDGEHVAFATKSEADYGGTYWATDEGNGAIEWEPTHFIALSALRTEPTGETGGAL